MLDSIFIAILFVAVIFQLVALYEKSVVFSIFTTMFWLILMVNVLFIESAPYYSQVYNVTSGNVVNASGTYVSHDPALGMLFLGFVFINIVLSIIQYMDFQNEGNLP